MEDKRRFTRIFFSTPATLVVGGNRYDTSLIDISLKGALITANIDLSHIKGEACQLNFLLQGSDIKIDMMGEIVHVEPDSLGLVCTKMDIQSASHLRRLIELNVGDAELLDREFTSLSHPKQKEA